MAERAAPGLRLVEESPAPGVSTLVDTLMGIAADVGHAADVELVPELLLQAVVRRTPWTSVCAAVHDVDSGRLVSRYHAGFAPKAVAEWQDILDARSPTMRAIRTGVSVHVPDVRSSDRYGFMAELCLGQGFESSLYVPIRLNGEEALTLSIHRPSAHVFTDAERDLAASIASLLAVSFRSVIARARAVASERVAIAELSRTNSRLLDKTTQLQRLTTVHHRLVHAQLAGAGVAGLCAEIGALLGLPVLVLDRFHQPIGGVGMEADPAELVDDLLRTARPSDGPPAAGQRPRVVRHARGDFLVGHAMDGQGSVGLVVAGPTAGTDAEQDLRAMELCCVYVALEMVTQRAELEAQVRLRRDFADALLSDEHPTTDVATRAAVIGLRMDVPNLVLRARVLGPDPEPAPTDMADLAALVQRTLAQAGPGGTVCALGGPDLLVAITADAARRHGVDRTISTIRATVSRAMEALPGVAAGTVETLVGVGGEGGGVAGLRTSHAEALRTLEVLVRVRGSGRVSMSIEEAGSYSLLTAMPVAEGAQFVARHLRSLVEYDRSHHSDLVATLRAYFAAVGNVQRTAEEMVTHISTVRYRLGRIEEITGLSLRNEDDRLCLQLALRLTVLNEGAPLPEG